MQLLRVPCLRLAWALALAAATFTRTSWAVDPVNFAKHGSDWATGQCKSRFRQSPVDLNEIFKPPQGGFQYKYDDVLDGDVQIVNDGRMLTATVVNRTSPLGGLAVDVMGEPTWFHLDSINVKSESEHTIRGKHYPLEIQLVHKPEQWFPNSEGPKAVTISLFVSCMDPPQAKPVYPGLLQEETRPRKLRGNAQKLRGNATALLQKSSRQIPDEESDAFYTPPPEVDEEEVASPTQQRMNSEVDFVHKLVEGEDALGAQPIYTLSQPTAAAAPAPSPGPGPGAADPVYAIPSAGAAEFNPLLQFLVESEPPDLDSSTNASQVSVRIGGLLNGGTYFYYWGSSTLPPCDDNEMWLIKREVIRASTAQVTALYKTLHLMTEGAGNFRTSMPVNERKIDVLSGKEEMPRQLQPTEPPHEVVSGQEEKYIDMAKDAMTIAKAASDYAKDLDYRLQRGATQHLKVMEGEQPVIAQLKLPVLQGAFMLPVTTVDGFVMGREIVIDLGTPYEEVNRIKAFGSLFLMEPLKYPHKAGTTVEMLDDIHTTPEPSTTSAFIPKPPEDQIWATKIMSNIVKAGIKQALEANIKEIIPATASLATSYLRQRILKKAGFHPPPIGANVVSVQPLPGVPTFFPPVQYQQPSAADIKEIAKLLRQQNCTAAANYVGCGNVTGLTPEQAQAMAQYLAANTERGDSEDEGMTPEQIAENLPPGVSPLPADFPDPDGWPSGTSLPITGVPPWTSDWPNPDGTIPAGWSEYQWERYKYNWGIYRSQYQPYQSYYSSYNWHRRRRMGSYSYSRSGSRYRSSYSSSSSSLRRRRSWSSSGRRRSSSSYSSRGRRRSSRWR